MIPSSVIKRHFSLKNGQLYRLDASGFAKRIRTLVGGRLVSRVDGVAYYGLDIAWVLYYGSASPYPVFTLDGNGHNLTRANLASTAKPRLRFRSYPVRGGFAHNLSPGFPFATLEACRADWAQLVAQTYAADLPMVLEAQERRDLEYVEPHYVKSPSRAVSASAGRVASVRPPIPYLPAGRRAYWYADQ